MTSAVAISPRTVAVFEQAGLVLKPPPNICVADWAEQNFILSSEDSAITGHYRSSRAPYQYEILNSIREPDVEEIVLKCAAQTVKTLAIKIWLAYFIKEMPSPILFMLPTLDLAKRVSRQRLAPMFRDVPVLRDLLDDRSRRSANSMLEKSFPGGVLFLVGANAPAGICSVPIRVFIADEVNRNNPSAGKEGSALSLGDERTVTFWDRKKVRCSTPTDEHGVISVEYEKTDMRLFYVPCRHCTDPDALVDFRAPWPFGEKIPSGYQVLEWERLVLDKEPPHTATVYACQACGAALTESDKLWMLRYGHWIAQHPEVKLRRGYMLNGLYSPFRTWAEITDKWFDALKHREDKTKQQVFINTVLAREYGDEAETLSSDDLKGRVEDYPCPVPDGVTVITAGVDVQADRIELLVRGWGKGQESWLIDRKVFEGDPSRLEGEDTVVSTDPDVAPVKRRSPWERLDEYLQRAFYLHARGVRLPIACTFIDSGYLSQVVYEFCKPRASRWIFAIKGVSGFGKPPLGTPTRNNRMRLRVYPLAVDEIKATIYRRLTLASPGAGYYHFSRTHCDDDYFAQLTVEQLKRKNVRGYRVRFWQKPEGARNEALDMEGYAWAAFLRLGDKPEELLKTLREQLLERAKFAAAERRAKVPAGQLPLLDVPRPEPEPEPEPDVQTSSDAEQLAEVPEAASVKPEATEPEAGLGENEYKIAEQLDEGGEDPEPEEESQIVVRRGSWL